MFEIWALFEDDVAKWAILVASRELNNETLQVLGQVGIQKVKTLEATTHAEAQQEMIEWVRGFQPDVEVQQADFKRALKELA